MGTYFWKKDEICLRRFKTEDSPYLLEMLRNTGYRKQADHGILLPVCDEDGEGFAEWADSDEDGTWLAIANKQDIIVGYTVLRNLDERNGTVEAFVTVFPKWQRNGYATSACRVLCEYAFYERRLHKINAFIIEENESGEAFLVANGFQRECVKRDMFYCHGHYLDEEGYGLCKEEFDCIMQNHTLHENSIVSHRNNSLPDKETLKSAKAHFEPVGHNTSDYWQYDGIRLRELREEDCVYWHQMLFDSDCCRVYNDDVMLPYNMGEITEFESEHLAFNDADGRLVFTIENEAKDYVGTIQLANVNKRHGTFTFSIYIDQNARHKGYGAKALFLLLNYAFFELRLHKCNTAVNEDNAASLQLMKKLGFRVEGIQKDMVYYKNNYVNKFVLGLLKDEFADCCDK